MVCFYYAGSGIVLNIRVIGLPLCVFLAWFRKPSCYWWGNGSIQKNWRCEKNKPRVFSFGTCIRSLEYHDRIAKNAPWSHIAMSASVLAACALCAQSCLGTLKQPKLKTRFAAGLAETNWNLCILCSWMIMAGLSHTPARSTWIHLAMLTSLQASQQAFVKVSNLNLFEYIR